MRRGEVPCQIRILLLGAILVASRVSAQSASCPNLSAPAREIARGWYTAPVAAGRIGDRLTVLGWPRYRLPVEGAAAQTGPTDTAFAGVEVSRTGLVTLPPWPGDSLPLDEPRISVRDGFLRVVYSEALIRSPSAPERDSSRIWTARWEGGAWKGRHLGGTFSQRGAVARQFGSDLVQVGSEDHFAMPNPWPRKVDEAVLYGTVREGLLKFEPIRVGLESVSYVDLLAFKGQRWMALSGYRLVRDSAGRSVMDDGVWLTRMGRDGWEPARKLIARDWAQYIEVQLVPSLDGLLVAFEAVDGARRELRWAAVDSMPGGRWNRRTVAGRLTKGQGELSSLLPLSTDDSTITIVRLSASGLDSLTSLRTYAGVPPVLAGTRLSPYAVGIRYAPDDTAAPIGLVEFDLRCIARR